MKENLKKEKKKGKEKLYIKIMEIGMRVNLKMIIFKEEDIMYGKKMDMNILGTI